MMQCPTTWLEEPYERDKEVEMEIKSQTKIPSLITHLGPLVVILIENNVIDNFYS